MADIIMTYESLGHAASQVNKAKSDLDEVITFLSNVVSSLDGNWSGESYQAFVDAWEKSKPTMQRLADAVERFAPELNTAVEEQREREHASAGRLGNLSF